MRSDNREALEGFFRRMDAEFGDGLALRIIKLMVEELGGLRVSVPSYVDLYRRERNRKMRNQFNGVNYREIALLWNLSEPQVRRIIDNRKEL